jgi:hypothetical protein
MIKTTCAFFSSAMAAGPQTGKRVRLLPSEEMSHGRTNDSAGDQSQNARRASLHPRGFIINLKSQDSRGITTLRPSPTIEVHLVCIPLAPLLYLWLRGSHCFSFQSQVLFPFQELLQHASFTTTSLFPFGSSPPESPLQPTYF